MNPFLHGKFPGSQQCAWDRGVYIIIKKKIEEKITKDPKAANTLREQLIHLKY
jgi:hypothetical protein